MIVVGAKGFAIQMHDVLYRLNETENLVFFDNISVGDPLRFLESYPILKSEDEVRKYFESVSDKRFILGVGGPSNRKYLFEKFIALGGEPYTVISKDALVGRFKTKIGEGVCVLSNSVIESTVHIGKGTLINLNVLVTHNSVIGEFCELSPGVRISGNCNIGDNVFIGTGAIILPGVTINDNSKIGAGAVVIHDVPEKSVFVGVPAKPIKK